MHRTDPFCYTTSQNRFLIRKSLSATFTLHTAPKIPSKKCRRSSCKWCPYPGANWGLPDPTSESHPAATGSPGRNFLPEHNGSKRGLRNPEDSGKDVTIKESELGERLCEGTGWIVSHKIVCALTCARWRIGFCYRSCSLYECFTLCRNKTCFTLKNCVKYLVILRETHVTMRGTPKMNRALR